MEYFELTITVYLLADIHFTCANESLSKIINGAMLLDNELANKHCTREFKFYCFNSLYPLETDKTYKQGRAYIFKIKSLEKEFVEKMAILLPKNENNVMKILAIQLKNIPKRQITELYTMTPAILTIDNKYWLPGDDLNILEKRFQSNLERKYKCFFNKQLDIKQGFIQFIEVLNRKPLCFVYKDTKLPGSKFKILVNEDATSQALAFIAEATGLGEKSSSAGMGFCNAQYLK